MTSDNQAAQPEPVEEPQTIDDADFDPNGQYFGLMEAPPAPFALVPLDALVQDDKNANRGTEQGDALIAESLRDYGAGRSVLLDANNKLIAGNKTAKNAAKAGIRKVLVVETDGDCLIAHKRRDLDMDNGSKARELALADNVATEVSLNWDAQVLDRLEAEGVAVSRFFSPERLDGLRETSSLDLDNAGGMSKEEAHRTLAERFGVPPFSVLDARQGYWQERKKAWLSLGIQSELGRDENLAFAASAQPPAVYALKNEMRAATGQEPKWEDVLAEARRRGVYVAAGTSIFDPVLCELAYRWFCPEGGRVLDPFAGGSVRGLVAAKLGRRYVGIDLRKEQVRANEANYGEFEAHCTLDHSICWMDGDSRERLTEGHPILDAPFDFVFSCPPYADLEKYSDDPRDLSNMEYSQFIEAYREIIWLACKQLKENRFACFVVGEVRAAKGEYYNFVGDTIAAFKACGLQYYNEAILVTQAGSLAIRASRMFESARKLGKSHQNVLVFAKGDPKEATKACGATEWGELKEEAAPA